ncbi:MAG: hypothetical protein IJD73_01740 [Clostridia bacterium]|nr:hypothetical protein [Clostridia bacterium]
MKKLLICLMALSLTLCSLVGCASDDLNGFNNNAYSSTVTTPTVNTPTINTPTVNTPAPADLGQQIYNDLVTASELCETYRYAVYNAWYFAIYEFDNYTGSQRLEAPQNSTIVTDFAIKVGIPQDEMRTIIANYPEGLGVYALGDFNSSVNFVLYALKDNGTEAELDSALSTAKTTLKDLTGTYSTYSECENLKNFYTEVNAYAEYLKNPTGSFETMKSTTQTHQSNVRTAKSALDFAFGD